MPRTQHLSLLREFVRRDFEGRYAGSVLGFLWSMIQPLWQLLLFGFIFGVLMKIPLDGEPTSTFWIFLFAALMPWLALQEGIQRSTTAITDNANLVKKIHFPSEILVATVVIAAVIHQAIAGALFLVALAIVGELDLSGLPLLFLALPLQLSLTTGMGLFVAASNIYLRDVSQLQGMLLMAWFYFTPIVYPMAMVRQVEDHGQLLEGMLLLNPATALVDLYRQAFLGGRLADVEGLASLAVCAVVALGGGWWLFRKLKPAFADEL
ncbi:MAG: ABC transporter permease [Thermoanaerobaculia bacterium]|nr:ABC transporter permease [Thermoanaerobaculia bacterium]